MIGVMMLVVSAITQSVDTAPVAWVIAYSPLTLCLWHWSSPALPRLPVVLTASDVEVVL